MRRLSIIAEYSKDIYYYVYREDRLQTKRQASNHEGKTNNVSGKFLSEYIIFYEELTDEINYI